jgi:photosystem I subunit 10
LEKVFTATVGLLTNLASIKGVTDCTKEKIDLQYYIYLPLTHRRTMYTEILLSVVPQTTIWSSKIAAIMIASNIFCIAIGRRANNKGTSTSLNLGSLTAFDLPELLACTSLGHIVGSGVILGLGYVNLI